MTRQLPLVFDCHGESLIGIVSVPDQATDTAMLVIVGGPQYRVGSHRQFLQLAKLAADNGFAAMHFDTRGMGDSEGRQRLFDEIGDDVAAAIDALQRCLPTVQRVGLWGLCGGASAALLYHRAKRDPRVAGVALVNPWVRSETTQARTRVKHYYLQRLLQREFWSKLFSGQVAAGALRELMRAVRVAVGPAPSGSAASHDAVLTLEQKMAEGLASFDGETLLVLSGNDYTAKEFLETVKLEPQWRRLLARTGVTRFDVAEADHTFSDPEAQAALEGSTIAWLRRLAPRGP